MSVPATMRGLVNRARDIPDFIPPTCIHNRAPLVARLCARPLAELDQRMRLRTNACEAGAGGRIGAALSLPWWPENLYAFSQERFLWIHGPRQPSFVDHLLREQGVGSSNLPAPTNT